MFFLTAKVSLFSKKHNSFSVKFNMSKTAFQVKTVFDILVYTVFLWKDNIFCEKALWIEKMVVPLQYEFFGNQKTCFTGVSRNKSCFFYVIAVIQYWIFFLSFRTPTINFALSICIIIICVYRD